MFVTSQNCGHVFVFVYRVEEPVVVKVVVVVKPAPRVLEVRSVITRLNKTKKEKLKKESKMVNEIPHNLNPFTPKIVQVHN